MNDEIMLRMNEDGSFGLYEPFANIECETEEDFVHLCEMVKLGESIVRCKNCKWWNEPGCAISIVDESDRPHENDFCSFGERRDDCE